MRYHVHIPLVDDLQPCISYRQAEAGDLFLGAFLPNDQGRTLIGYVCATSSPEPTLTHESMSKHVPSSASVCIHSVCVSDDHRRKGIALGLLREYIARLEKAHQEGSPYERILLIVHEELRPLYEKAGFEFVGKSPVVHGPRPWYEMKRVLSGPAPTAQPVIESSLLTDIVPRADLAALFQQSLNSRDRPTAKLLSSFSAGVRDLTDDSPEPHNKFDLLCPKPECGSVILKKSVATLADRDSVLLEPAEKQESPSWFPLLPEPGSSTQWWRITPNPMAFENIGFSRPVGGQRKFLM